MAKAKAIKAIFTYDKAENSDDKNLADTLKKLVKLTLYNRLLS